MTPNASKTLKTQRTFIDLDTFEDVTLAKTGTFIPVTTNAEAVERVGGDTAKFLDLLNKGLYAMEQAALLENDSLPWRVVNEKNQVTDTVYTGQTADSSIVNPLVLNIAKAACGYLTAKNAEEKRASKDAAIEMIKSNAKMLEGIKKQSAAAIKAESEDSPESTPAA